MDTEENAPPPGGSNQARDALRLAENQQRQKVLKDTRRKARRDQKDLAFQQGNTEAADLMITDSEDENFDAAVYTAAVVVAATNASAQVAATLAGPTTTGSTPATASLVATATCSASTFTTNTPSAGGGLPYTADLGQADGWITVPPGQHVGVRAQGFIYRVQVDKQNNQYIQGTFLHTGARLRIPKADLIPDPTFNKMVDPAAPAATPATTGGGGAAGLPPGVAGGGPGVGATQPGGSGHQGANLAGGNVTSSGPTLFNHR